MSEVSSHLVVLNDNSMFNVGNRSENTSPKNDNILLHTLEKEIILEFETIMLFVVLATSLVSNGVVLLIFYRKPLLRTPSNSFVLNLSVTHLLHLLFVLPFTLTSLIYRDWIFGDIWCQVSETVSLCLNVETVFSLLLIAVDRNCAISSPLHYKTTTNKRKVYLLIASTWFSAIFISLPPVFGVTAIKYEKAWYGCVSLGSRTGYITTLYTSLLALVGFVLPYFYTIWIYFVLFKAARANKARTKQNSFRTVSSYAKNPVEGPFGMSDTLFYRMKPCRRSFSSSQLSLFGKECKAVRTVLLVVLSFIACWGPYFTVLFLNSYITQDTWMPAYFPLVVIFLSSSSCFIDPYIYVFRNETLQKHIKKLFHSHTPKRFGNRKMGTVVGINHLRSTTNIDQQDKTRRHRSYGATFNNQKDTYLHRSPTRKHHVPRRGPRSNVKLSHRSLAEYSKSPSSYTEVPLNVTRKASVFYLYNIHLHALRWKV